MSIFNEDKIIYVSSQHAEEQLELRTGVRYVNPTEEVERLANEGELLLEVDNYRYIKNGNLYLPCIQYTGKPANYYRVKSVLTWDMVSHRFQNVIDNYHLYKISN